MGVSIIENWTDISGVVLDNSLPARARGYTGVEVRVERASPVEGFANLLEDAAGKTLLVLMPAETAREKQVSPGRRVHCRVRVKGPHTIFANQETVRTSP